MRITPYLIRSKMNLIFTILCIYIAFPFSVSADEIPANDFESLKDAIGTAADGDSIIIGGSFALNEPLIVDKSLTFRAPEKATLTVDGNFRHIDVREYNGGDVTLVFDNVALVGRKSSPHDDTAGGGIVITRTNGTGTIHTLHLENAVIQNCHNGSYGGGIGFTWPPGQPVIDNCNLEISGADTDISYNSANRGGGVSANRITVNDGAIHDNKADVWAGGVYAYGGLTMNGGAINGNTAGSYGGGSANYHGDYTINGGTISGNEAGEAGGGVYAGYGLTMTGGNMDGNSAGDFGGGIYANTVEIGGGEIRGNTSGKGGGITFFEEMQMDSGEISGNMAEQDGGGIFAYYFEGYSKDTTVTGGLISGNMAERNGGGIYSEGGISISGVVFDGNISGNDGGGIWISDLGRLTSSNVTFRNNMAHAGYIWDINKPSDEVQASDTHIHKSNILGTAYTAPFSNAYSNYDVNYASGTLWIGDDSDENGVTGTENGTTGSENGVTDTENGTTGAIGTGNTVTGEKVYNRRDEARTEITGNGIVLGSVEKELRPLAPIPDITNPMPEVHPLPETKHPNTGRQSGFVFLSVMLLCAGAVTGRGRD